MKIGILGGSFQPVHHAHIQMASSACERLGLDRVLLMPSNIPPHKEMADGANAKDRWNMVCLAAEGKTWLAPEDLELRREGPSYSVDTLRQLRERWPDAELFFVMGSDMLGSFDTWREPAQVAALATLVCISRDDADDRTAMDHIKTAYGARTLLLPPALPISSTMVRERVTNALPITNLVPPAVEDYIYERGLYQPEGIRVAMDKLRAALPGRRLTHSVSTMRTAIALADQYGVGGAQARLAALLHDCAKALPLEEQRKLSDDDTDISQIWHAGASAALAKAEYGVNDAQVLRAIALHTTGDTGMTALDKVIYLADVIEPGRRLPFVKNIHQKTALNDAILLALCHSICYIQKAGGSLHPATLRAYQDLGGKQTELHDKII